MFVVEALAMGQPVMFKRAKDERGARRLADEMRETFAPRDGREIVLRLRSSGAVLAWWTAAASCWQVLGTIAGAVGG
jgi:hypothetical protein